MKCECGCGQDTPIAYESDATKGWKKGEPLRFVRYHNRRSYRKYGPHTDSPEYKAWWSMLERCENLSHPQYHNYGGRGICVVGLMRDFSTFLSEIKERPSDRHSIDRINNNGNYEVGNVRWATPIQQARNKRHKLSLQNIREIRAQMGIMKATSLAARYGVCDRTIYQIWSGETWDEHERTAEASTY